MAISYDIDPQDERTWVNHAAPSIEPCYRRELEGLGNGRLRFAWGQEFRQFWAGEMRILYTDDRLEPVVAHEPDYIAARNLETQEVTPLSSYAELLDYDEKFYERIFKRGKSHAEFIGQPLWFIQERRPIQESEASWERNRYGDWEDPATGKTLRGIDLLGERPAQRFEAFFVVGQPSGETDQFGRRVLKYRPIGEDVMRSIRRKLHELQTAPKLSTEQMIARMYEKQRMKERAQSVELGERIRSDLWPHRHRLVEGGAMIGYTAADKNIKDFKGAL